MGAASELGAPPLVTSLWALPFSGSDLAFLIPSRGSSWHRCPMFRFTHLVHGRSCKNRSVSEKRASGRIHSQGRKSYASNCNVSKYYKVVVTQQTPCFGCQEDGCGLPNVCNKCTLIGSKEVSKDCREHQKGTALESYHD